MENLQEIQAKGGMPLEPEHICFDKGHSMFSVYTVHNHQSSWGENKCGRCGYVDHWQYDFQGSNPMHNNG